MRSLEGFRYSYNVTLNAIVRSYEISRATLDENLQHLDGTPIFANGNVEDSLDESYDDWAIDKLYEADTSISVIREAFTLVLFHYWEKSAQIWLGDKNYKFSKNHKRLTKDGRYIVDYDNLELMRLVANTIKHHNKALHNNHPEMFDAIIGHYIKENSLPPYGSLIRLTDGDMDNFISALKMSGPNAEPIPQF